MLVYSNASMSNELNLLRQIQRIIYSLGRLFEIALIPRLFFYFVFL